MIASREVSLYAREGPGALLRLRPGDRGHDALMQSQNSMLKALEHALRDCFWDHGRDYAIVGQEWRRIQRAEGDLSQEAWFAMRDFFASGLPWFWFD